MTPFVGASIIAVVSAVIVWAVRGALASGSKLAPFHAALPRPHSDLGDAEGSTAVER